MSQIKFNKEELLNRVIQQLEVDLQGLIVAAQANLDAATNEESKPENEYDTRALEAGYIAGAQSQRAREIEESLLVLKKLKVRDFKSTDKIDVTALVSLQSEKEKSWVFLLPRGAGQTLVQQGIKIKVITGQSPLGEALLKQEVGEFISVITAKTSMDYEILEIY
ncbi:MAG: GreA/GreB family elongation factor [Bdellovibrionales bacterium]